MQCAYEEKGRMICKGYLRSRTPRRRERGVSRTSNQKLRQYANPGGTRRSLEQRNGHLEKSTFVSQRQQFQAVKLRRIQRKPTSQFQPEPESSSVTLVDSNNSSVDALSHCRRPRDEDLVDLAASQRQQRVRYTATGDGSRLCSYLAIELLVILLAAVGCAPQSSVSELEVHVATLQFGLDQARIDHQR